MDDNPTQIQWAPAAQYPRNTPLVLIHDGGGTTFGYFTLDDLGREVHGIHNPHYYTGEPWVGGMDEMARHYIQLLKDARISGKILLGGWSLGGLLSLTMARMLASDDTTTIHVTGILMIDSPVHVPWTKLPVSSARTDLSHLPELVRKSLDNCGPMLKTWELPTWNEAALKERPACIKFRQPGPGKAEIAVPSGHVWYSPLHGSPSLKPVAQIQHDDKTGQDGSTSIPPSKHGLVPPPAVLLRCVDRTVSMDPSKPARVDIFRDSMMLGWDENYPEFIKAVVDVDSHHFNIFDFSKTESTTAKINEGLAILESQKGWIAS